MEDWTTIKEELYNNIQILTAHALAKGKQMQTEQEDRRAEGGRSRSRVDQ